jgi:hypothetical protein
MIVLLMRKTKSSRKTAKKSASKKARVVAKRKVRNIKITKKTATRRKIRKSYDSQMGRPTGRDVTALARLDELTREYVAGGMDDVGMDRSIFISRTSPSADKEATWLPAPKGPFNLTMRLYAPRSDSLTGKWNPPPVTRMASLPSLGGQ